MSILHLHSVGDYHRRLGLPQPAHPLISVLDYAEVRRASPDEAVSMTFDYYVVSVKKGLDLKMTYGQQSYDFDEGIMFCMAPGQVLRIARDTGAPVQIPSGWMLLIHPDFLWGTALAAGIRRYDYFDYAAHEALFLSDKEEAILDGILSNIRGEIESNIDRFSQGIVIAQLELLLNYGERFYQRQFITRKKASHEVLERLEAALSLHLSDAALEARGLPGVARIAAELHLSPNYLSALLKNLTGHNMQQLIHDRLIARAKEKLSTTQLSVSEIAYALGFEHPQSFSRLFKRQTRLSPLEFRQAFN